MYLIWLFHEQFKLCVAAYNLKGLVWRGYMLMIQGYKKVQTWKIPIFQLVKCQAHMNWGFWVWFFMPPSAFWLEYCKYPECSWWQLTTVDHIKVSVTATDCCQRHFDHEMTATDCDIHDWVIIEQGWMCTSKLRSIWTQICRAGSNWEFWTLASIGDVIFQCISLWKICLPHESKRYQTMTWEMNSRSW